MHLNSNFTLDVRLRIYWLSEELTALADARSGRCTLPVSVDVFHTESGVQISAPTGNQAFSDSLRAALTGTAQSAEDLAAFEERVCAALPQAIASVVEQKPNGGRELTGVEIPLTLPALDRKTWRVRTALLPSLAVTAVGGALYGTGAEPGGPCAAASALATLVKLPAVVAQDGAPVTFTFAGRLTKERLQRFRNTLALYSFGPTMEDHLSSLDDGADVRLTVNLPASAASLWATTPGEREVAFLPVWSKVTHAVQRALRAWVPLIALQKAEDFARMDCAPAVIAYGLTRSYCGRSKTQLTYDILDSETMKSANYSIGRALPAAMAHVHEVLTDAGLSEAARPYRPIRFPDLLQMIKSDRRLLPALMQLDGLLVNDLIEFAANAKRVTERSRREPQRALVDAVRGGQDFGRRFQRRLAALLPNVELAGMLELALIEATAALSPEDPREAVVTIAGVTFTSQPHLEPAAWQCAA